MLSIKIQTAQNVTIEYQLASLGERIVAVIIDALIKFAYIFAVLMALSKLNFNVPSPTWVLVALPYLFYELVLEILLDGQTIGKKAMNIKVVKMDGSLPTLSSYFLRWLLRLLEITILNGLVALIAILFTTYNQRLGDLAAGTCVIKVNKSYEHARPELASIDDSITYTPYFAHISNLSDRDVNIVREVLQAYRKTTNYQLIITLYERLQEVLLAQDSNLAPLDFLEQVLKDYDNTMLRK